MKSVLALSIFIFLYLTEARPRFDNEINSRIVGGYYANINQFPYQVALYRYNLFTCGGSIIRKNWVLTASHCIVSGVPSSFKVLSGTIFRSLDGNGTVHEVETLITHENYGNFRNDIALIKIKGEFNIGDAQQIIELNTDDVPIDAEIIISGWGRVETGGSLSKILKWHTLKKTSSTSCGSAVGFSDGLICLSHPPQNGACNGDSGSPAVYNGKLIGAANFVINGCGSSYPDGYVRVAYFFDWIQNNINKHDNILVSFI